jgi:DNA-directed RNA polymerase specialized sigma24 family protein
MGSLNWIKPCGAFSFYTYHLCMSGEFRERRVWQENAARYIERAKIAARKKGFYEDADDLAQSLILAMLEGRHKHATIDQAIIDVIRAEHGRPSSGSFAAKKALRQGVKHLSDADNLKFRSVDPRKRMDDGLDYTRMVKALPKREDKIIFILHHKWGFLNAEIGEMFGVTNTRINQRLAAIHRNLRVMLENEEAQRAPKVINLRSPKAKEAKKSSKRALK